MAVGCASVIDRNRALQHFGSEGVMDSLLQRFPETVRGTLCRLRAAWMEGRDEDLRCHIYQIRGAASWVCADRLLDATEELMRAYQERKCCDELEPQVGAAWVLALALALLMILTPAPILALT